MHEIYNIIVHFANSSAKSVNAKLKCRILSKAVRLTAIAGEKLCVMYNGWV
jgi:hypothetical protein